MKKILLLSILSIFLVALSANAAPEPKIEVSTSPSVKLSGVVFDNQTNESLAGAIITANGQKVYSDFDGNFLLDNLCEGKCQVKISMISYQDQTVMVDLNNMSSLEVNLKQR